MEGVAERVDGRTRRGGAGGSGTRGNGRGDAAGPREQTKREQYAAAMAEKRRREAEAADGWVDFQSSFDREFQAGD